MRVEYQFLTLAMAGLNVHWAYIKGDATNAFNQVCRAAMFRRVAATTPRLLILVLNLYLYRSPMFFFYSAGGYRVTYSSVGVHQGCVLGSLLF